MLGILGKMLGTVVEHLLDLEDVATASVGTGVQNDRRILGNLVLHRLESLNHGIGLLHSSEEEQTKAEAQESRMRVVQLLVGGLHHPLDDSAAHRLVTLANVDHTQSQSSKRHLEHTVGATLGRLDNGKEEVHHLLPSGTGVGNTKTGAGGALHNVHIALDVLRQQRQGRVGIVLDAAAEDADGKSCTGLDVVLGRVQELIDLRQTLLDVPEEDGAERCRGRHHAVVLVLVQPLVVGRHELVLAEASVDEGIDEGTGKVGPGGIDLRTTGVPPATEAAGLGEVGLVDVLGSFGLHDVEVLGDLEELLAELDVANQLVELILVVVVLNLVVDPVTGQEEAHLLLHQAVLGGTNLLKELGDRLLVAHAQSDAEGVEELALRPEQLVGRLEHLDVVVGVGHEVGRLGEVQTDAAIVVLVDGVQVQELLEALDLDEEVDRLGLGVVRYVEGDDDVDHGEEVGELGVVVGVGPGDDAGVVLLPDLPGEAPDELVPPGPEVVVIGTGGGRVGLVILEGRQFELEGLSLLVLAHRHGQNRQNIGQPRPEGEHLHVGLDDRVGDAGMELLEGIKVGPQKFQRLGDAGHARRGAAELGNDDVQGPEAEGDRDGRLVRGIGHGGNAGLEPILELLVLLRQGVLLDDGIVLVALALFLALLGLLARFLLARGLVPVLLRLGLVGLGRQVHRRVLVVAVGGRHGRAVWT
mmetsp:Transcript_26313/g.75965  ORF Transcript_26313/g.75965 Transcript_26313/m.75965 type:complete len:697 (+) Transcript_26313:933-3023(+)